MSRSIQSTFVRFLTSSAALLLVLIAVPVAAEENDEGTAKELEIEQRKEDAARSERRRLRSIEIARFIDLRLDDSSMPLSVDKMNGALVPPTMEAARAVDYGIRQTTASVAFRVEAGSGFGGCFRAGYAKVSISRVYFPVTDLTMAPVTEKVTETLDMDMGLDCGFGAELRFWMSEPLRAGVFYEIGYTVAKIDNGLFLNESINGEYRCFTHTFLFFADLVLDIEKPFKGIARPRIGLGGSVVRASTDFSSADGARQADFDWIAETAFILTLALHIETADKVYGFLEFELGGRISMTAGVGIRV